jgi:hypothetical protein
VGDIDDYHLNDLRRKTERYIKRKIRTIVFSPEEYNRFADKLKGKPHLLLWNKNQ